MLLDGKVALVTGAGRGLGRAHALALAAAGARVMVNDLGGGVTGAGADEVPARAVAEEIAAAGGEAAADGSDVATWDGAGTLVERTVTRFGRLDILVNNAGICRPTAFGTLAEADWDRLMDVNAKGTAAPIEAAARHWREAGPAPGRAILSTASPQGAHPVAPIGIYSVSKAAVLALTQVAAQELAPLGVRANALAPVARTRMVGQATDAERSMPRDAGFDRFDPAHVAQVVLYLVSPLCAFTGRLFGASGDTVVLYDEWDGSRRVDNARAAWTPDTLAAALATLPTQQTRHMLAPAGLLAVPSPTDATLAALGAA